MERILQFADTKTRDKETTLNFPVGKIQKMHERCRVSKYSERVFRTGENNFFFK